MRVVSKASMRVGGKRKWITCRTLCGADDGAEGFEASVAR
jgi:hypothetical protein